jgi:hypothetical protein
MAKWNTQKVISDLSKIPTIIDITDDGPGGDVDTDNLIIEIDGANEQLWVCGFDDENDIIDSSDVDVPFIELTDGLDSRGGLNSRNPKVAKVYIDIRQYFLDLGFEVVTTHKAFF